MLSGGRSRPIPPMSGPRYGARSVIIDNEMWVMGGDDEDRDPLATVEVYSPKTNSWRSCTPMSQRRDGAVAGVVGGRLVVAGGWCDGHLSSVEAYTGTGWTLLPPMPHYAWLATGCVLNGRLYVMGGYRSNKLQVLEMTEENGLAWTVKADLPATRWGAASTVHEGKIWVIGGTIAGEPSASVDTYDADADTWATGPPLPFPQQDCTATAIDGRVYLCGSVPGSTLVHRFEGAAWSRTAEVHGYVYATTCGAVILG